MGNTDIITNTISMEGRIETREAGSLFRMCFSGAALIAGLDETGRLSS